MEDAFKDVSLSEFYVPSIPLSSLTQVEDEVLNGAGAPEVGLYDAELSLPEEVPVYGAEAGCAGQVGPQGPVAMVPEDPTWDQQWYIDTTMTPSGWRTVARSCEVGNGQPGLMHEASEPMSISPVRYQAPFQGVLPVLEPLVGLGSLPLASSATASDRDQSFAPLEKPQLEVNFSRFSLSAEFLQSFQASGSVNGLRLVHQAV